MALSFNSVILMGYLGRDPEISYSQSGTAKGKFSLSVADKPYGDKPAKTNWVPIVVWAAVAESCKEHLTKGSAVLVDGRIQVDTWQTKQGTSRMSIYVSARSVTFLGSGRGGVAHNEEEISGEDVPF